MSPTSRKTTLPYRLAAPLCLLAVTQAPALAGAAGTQVLLAAAPPGTEADPNRIDGLTVEELDDGTTVLRVQGSRKPTFNVYRLSDPERLVVDVAGSEPGKVVPHVPLDTWACGRVTVDGVQERDTNLVRVVVSLKREASYIVLPKDGELVITVTPREMAPEAYFAHKSAAERRAEIERDAHEAKTLQADAKTLQADAKALRAEARALQGHAREQAAEADRKVSEAAAQAEAARASEARAKAAELRAAASEAQARQTLADAKNGKTKLRRGLRQAEHARTRAERERAQAQAERTRAESVLSRAKAELEAEREQLARARGKTEAERGRLAKARTRAEQAETAAKAELRKARGKSEQAEKDAAKLLAAARSEVASVEAAAEDARTKAAAALAKAEKAEKDAARAAKAADTAAKRKLEAAAAEATRALEAARADAAATEAEAKRTKARAEAALAKAEKAAAQKLESAGEAEAAAKALLAQARVDAEREAEQQQAASKKLAAAEKLESEAKQKADAKLAAADKREAEVEKTAGAKLRAAEEREQKADAKLAVAAKREAEAKQKADAKLQAAEKLEADAKQKADAIVAEAEARAAGKVASAERNAERQAKAELARAEQEAVRKQEQAEAALAKAERALTDAEAERKAAVTARKRAGEHLVRTEKAVRKAEQRGAMTDELQRTLTEAKQAKTQAEQRVTAAQGEVAELEAGREALERTLADQRAQSEALAGEITASKQELAGLERKVAQARRALEDGVGKPEAAPAAAASSSGARKGERPEAAPAAAASSSGARKGERPAAAPADAATGAFIRDVRFEDGDDEALVIIELDGPVAFEGRTLTPEIQLLALTGARIDPRLERSLDASAYAGPVERITSFAEDGGAKVIVATRGPAKPRLEQADGKLVWHFPHGAQVAREGAKKDLAREEGAAPRPPAHEVSSLPGTKVGGFSTATPPLAAMLAPGPTNGSRSIGQSEPQSTAPVRGSTRWRGERIDIELQDAPIKDVLLLFSDIGRVNIIAGNNVEGSVTMKLTAVPWDQALDIILRSLNLGMVREGNVIRVATSEDLENERRQAIEQANARVQLKPLETRLVPISYATVDEMIPKVQSVLSPRGTVTPDSRTNTLIIMDVAENIALAEQLVASLDTQTPQVLIEARIVEARSSFQRTLGIQWGFDFTASPGTGNPTGLVFPNSVGIGGGATGTPINTRGLVLPGAARNPNYVVDLPAPVGTGSGGALGFSFGSISGNLNTNLRLSQLEETGEIRIISAPKIITLDNSEAQIEQGVQIPISQVSAQGVNTRFVNATLALRVTPHVTNEGAVLLDVEVQKNEADFINTGARGDPTILTKQARSRMIVNDSDTAVIGGIYTRTKAVNWSKMPFLADIPIVGWFFKNKNEADTRSEVLIFLTPKIVNRASSIGG